MEIDFTELRNSVLMQIGDQSYKLEEAYEANLLHGMSPLEATNAAATVHAVEFAVEVAERMLKEYHQRLMAYLNNP